ncbi:MAG TPA: FCD domain-containing protein [Thermoleophilaceae bacterium]|nr:FCD domain-containing protein [Thermoleophilaceae bacterium]
MKAERPNFERIEQLRAHEYVAEQIRRQIGLRLIDTGQSLPSDRELAEMFGVARTTVQAAIHLLEADRLVETRRGRRGGTFVIAPSGDGLSRDYLLARLRSSAAAIRQALTFRAAVEPLAASLAAAEWTRPELAATRRAASRAAAAEDDPSFMAGDTEFHLVIARAAHNQFVYSAVEQTRLMLNDALMALPESDLWHRRSVDEHEAILEAITERDADGAARAMRLHADSTEQSITALLRSVELRRARPRTRARAR